MTRFFVASLLYGALALSAFGADSADWKIEVQAKSHGLVSAETWMRETKGTEKSVSLRFKNGRRVRVPLTDEEIEILSYELGPLSLKKKKILELGICGQFLRIETQFGSRKFCQKQYRKDRRLGDLLAKLEAYRRLALHN